MVIWSVLAAVVLGLLVLALAVRRVLAALRPLHRAALTLRRRQADAEMLQTGVDEMQERLERLATGAGAARRRLEVIKVRNSG